MASFKTELPLLNSDSAGSSCGFKAAAPITAGQRTISLDEFFQRIGYVTLKLTNGCNLSCAYCNVEAVTPKTPRMSIERYKEVAQLLLKNSRKDSVGLEFHGGEPLLLPDEWFEEAVSYGRALARQYRKQVDFPIVTNGTLLTEERLLRLHKLGIQFCMSVDGPPEINDKSRGSGHAVERAIQLFRKHNIHFGVLTVMNRANYAHMAEIMDWFDGVGITDFRVNFLEPQGRGNDDDLVLSGPEMFEGMKQILHHMARTRVRVQEAETMQNVIRFIYGRSTQPGLTCWELECQAGRIYVAVDHNGTIHSCGTDLKNHILGSLDRDMDLDHYDSTLRRLHAKDDWIIRCFDCEARKICRHSCPTSDYNSKLFREYECDFTIRLYNYMKQHPELATVVDTVMQQRFLPQMGQFVAESDLRLV